MLRSICLATLVLVAATSATAQQTESDIVVVGDRLDEVTRAFIEEIAAPSLRENQLARWDQAVCVGAAGLAAADAQRVVDRISARADALGLRLGEPGCTANIMVIFTANSDAVAREIVDSRPRKLGYYPNYAISTAGRGALEAFANTPRPIRWWHVARNTTADGEALVETSATPGPMSSSERMDLRDTQVTRSSGTRLQRPTRQDLEYILVIVDARRVETIPASAWIDYVAMVSLAQIAADAEPVQTPSILNLFSAAPGVTPSALTAWDEAYLRGLYSATREAPNARSQQREIRRSMVASLTEAGPEHTND